MKFAVIETGGKQYQVREGEKVRVEKLPKSKGEGLLFEKVLLRADGERIEVGKPYVSGASVQAKVLEQGRDDKKIVYRFHSKTRYRKKKGHRQSYTEVEILKI